MVSGRWDVGWEGGGGGDDEGQKEPQVTHVEALPFVFSPIYFLLEPERE